MREAKGNARRFCLVLAAVAAVALPGASWLSESSNSADRDTASWVGRPSTEDAPGSPA